MRSFSASLRAQWVEGGRGGRLEGTRIEKAGEAAMGGTMEARVNSSTVESEGERIIIQKR